MMIKWDTKKLNYDKGKKKKLLVMYLIKEAHHVHSIQ